MDIKEYSLQEGMLFVSDMLQAKFVGQFMKAPTSGNNVICYLANGVDNTCVTFYKTEEGVRYLQDVITKLASIIMTISVREGVQKMDDSPYCYGEDYVSKFKVLRKVVKFSYIFETVMGKPEQWRKHRLSAKSASVYNKFSSEELQQINDAIRTIAINLASIKLVSDNK